MRVETADDGRRVWRWLSDLGALLGPSLAGVLCRVLMAGGPCAGLMGFAMVLCLVCCSVVQSISRGGKGVEAFGVWSMLPEGTAGWVGGGSHFVWMG